MAPDESGQFTLGNSNGYKLSSSFVAFKNKSGHLANNWLRALHRNTRYGIQQKLNKCHQEYLLMQ